MLLTFISYTPDRRRRVHAAGPWIAGRRVVLTDGWGSPQPFATHIQFQSDGSLMRGNYYYSFSLGRENFAHRCTSELDFQGHQEDLEYLKKVEGR